MAKISTYEDVIDPKLDDKLIGTSVGPSEDGKFEDVTYNFTLGQLLNLFTSGLSGGQTLQQVVDEGNTIVLQTNVEKGIEITLANLPTVYQNGVLVTIPNQTGSPYPDFRASPDAYSAKIYGQSPSELLGFVGGFSVEAEGLDNIGFFGELKDNAGSSVGSLFYSRDAHDGDFYRAVKYILGGGTTVFKVANNGSIFSVVDADISGLTIGKGGGNISDNTAIGRAALRNNTSGNSSTAIGYEALNYNTTGSDNVANGYRSLYSNTTGSDNVANGVLALRSNTTGSDNVANGLFSLYYNTSGNGNVANGSTSLHYNTSGYNNVANGQQTLFYNTTGFYNVATGSLSLFSNTTGFGNVANGNEALYSNTTGIYSTANGYQSLYANTTGSYNVANGYQALYYNITGNSNVAIGGFSLYYNTAGTNNLANGYLTLYLNTTGNNNVANGVSALTSNVSGNNNTANGATSLFANTTGSDNAANGFQSLYSNTTGSNNVATGYQAAKYIADTLTPATILNDSIFIGYRTSPLANNQTNQVVIGHDATGLGSNTTVLGNSSTVTTGIFGNIRLTSGMSTAPASATDAGTIGDIRVTTDFIYVCVATNTWRRTALTSW